MLKVESATLSKLLHHLTSSRVMFLLCVHVLSCHCTDKLFMVLVRKVQGDKMSHDSICKVQLEHQIRELHNEIDNELTTPATDVTS